MTINWAKVVRYGLWVFALNILASASAMSQEEAPLKLEATIKGNKEQPQVISIVPWQLPKYRSIEGTLDWQPQSTQPVTLERSHFLRRVALTQQFSGATRTNPTTTQPESDRE